MAATTHRRFLGIDPGLNRTGYALLERSPQGPILCEGGVIRSTRGLPLAERVFEIGSGLREVMEEFNPLEMAIEQVFSLVRNPKSALLMAHARGAILMAAAERHVPVVHYSPTQIKRLLTGSGRASKEQIQQTTFLSSSKTAPRYSGRHNSSSLQPLDACQRVSHTKSEIHWVRSATLHNYWENQQIWMQLTSV